MMRPEVDLAIDWAAAEGWNPGLHDAACFYAADPDGFLVGLVDDKPVATISVVRYGASFGFLGLYIVAPAHRGRGYGLAMWNAGLAHLRGRVIGLDGVVAQQPNYRRSGFALAYRNIRWEGAAHAAVADPRIVALASVPFDAVEAFDQTLFPAERARFLQCWIRPPQGAALGIVGDGTLAGYGVIRAARQGFKIGPLGARDAAIAEALFDALVGRVTPGSAVYLDTPQPNRSAVALAERRGMTPVFETARMYAGVAPDTPLDRLFGVTTFELG